jgi:hypothetical protein
MKNWPKWAKVLAAIAAVVVLLLGLTAGAGWLLWQKYGGQVKGVVQEQGQRLAKQGQVAEEEGRAYAKGRDQQACLTKSLSTVVACDGILCEAMQRIFLKGCLETAKPVAQFCTDVPASSAVMKSAIWSLSVCDAQGHADSQPCTRLLRAVQKHCDDKP